KNPYESVLENTIRFRSGPCITKTNPKEFFFAEVVKLGLGTSIAPYTTGHKTCELLGLFCGNASHPFTTQFSNCSSDINSSLNYQNANTFFPPSSKKLRDTLLSLEMCISHRKRGVIFLRSDAQLTNRAPVEVNPIH